MRMHNAWEFDNILDTAKAIDLKMHFNMAVHFTFERPNGYGNVYWDWSAAGDSLNTPILRGVKMGVLGTSIQVIVIEKIWG